MNSLPWPDMVLDYLNTTSLTNPTSLQSLLWPAGLHLRSVLAVAPAGQGKTLGWLLPVLSHMSLYDQSTSASLLQGPQALVLCPGVEVATRTVAVIREVLVRTGLQLTLHQDTSSLREDELLPVLGSDILVTTLTRFARRCGDMAPDSLLERCGHLVLHHADLLLEEVEVEQVLGLVEVWREARVGYSGQLVAVAERWCSLLEPFCSQILASFNRPAVVVAGFVEGAAYGQLGSLPIFIKTLKEKEAEVMALAAKEKEGLVVCCREAAAADRVTSLLAIHGAVSLQVVEDIQKLGSTWTSPLKVPLVVTDKVLALLPNGLQASLLIHWDMSSSTSCLSKRLIFVRDGLRNVFQPGNLLRSVEVRLLVLPEDMVCLVTLSPWLQRCGVQVQLPEDHLAESRNRCGGEGSSEVLERQEGRPTGWNREAVERNLENEAVFHLKFSLEERQRQFQKFCLVVIDNPEVEDKFDQAFSVGKRNSKEPLYRSYCELRTRAECSEEEAFREVLESVVPREVERPPRAGSRYPGGQGR